MQSEIIETPKKIKIRIGESGIRFPSGVALMPVLRAKPVPGDRRKAKNKAKLGRPLRGKGNRRAKPGLPSQRAGLKRGKGVKALPPKPKSKRKRRYDLTRWVMILPLTKSNSTQRDVFQPEIPRDAPVTKKQRGMRPRPLGLKV